MRRVLFLLVGIGLVADNPAWAARPPATTVQLVSEAASIQPGVPLWVGLQLTMDPGWHTYWRNPGDAGLATSVRWEFPEGFSAGPIQWPVPERIETSSIVSYGYEGEALLLSQMTPPKTLTPGSSVPLKGRVDWVECQDVCVKRQAEVSLELPVKAEPPGPDPQWAKAFECARAQQPAMLPEWNVAAAMKGKQVLIKATAKPDATGIVKGVQFVTEGIQFFPAEPGVIDHAAPQPIASVSDGVVITLAPSPYSDGPPRRLTGILVSPQGWLGPGSPTALAVDVPVEPKPSW